MNHRLDLHATRGLAARASRPAAAAAVSQLLTKRQRGCSLAKAASCLAMVWRRRSGTDLHGSSHEKAVAHLRRQGVAPVSGSAGLMVDLAAEAFGVAGRVRLQQSLPALTTAEWWLLA